MTEATTTEKTETTAATTEAAASTTAATTIVAAAAETTTETGTTETTKTESAAPDWRAQLAGEDKQFRTQLDRMADLGAVGKKLRSLEQRFSSGEFKKALPEGATAEETTTWRKENGLPDKAEGYVEKLELPKGLVIGESDKPIVSEFAAAALDGNVEPGQFNRMVGKYYEILDKQRAAQEDADVGFKQASEETLRSEWQGADFRRNLTAVNNLIATWPEGLAAKVLAGRDPDGRKLGDNPLFIKQLASLALELNPTATLVPAGTTDPNKSVAEELEAIRQMRRDDPNKYEADKKLQARELELLEAQLKTQKRVA